MSNTNLIRLHVRLNHKLFLLTVMRFDCCAVVRQYPSALTHKHTGEKRFLYKTKNVNIFTLF